MAGTSRSKLGHFIGIGIVNTMDILVSKMCAVGGKFSLK